MHFLFSSSSRRHSISDHVFPELSVLVVLITFSRVLLFDQHVPRLSQYFILCLPLHLLPPILPIITDFPHRFSSVHVQRILTAACEMFPTIISNSCCIFHQLLHIGYCANATIEDTVSYLSYVNLHKVVDCFFVCVSCRQISFTNNQRLT